MANVTFERNADLAGAVVVKGLPSDEKKRTAEVQKIRTAVKTAKGTLITRENNKRVYACDSQDQIDAVNAADPMTRQGREAAYKAEDIFSS